MAKPDAPDDPDALERGDGLPDVRGEPEPDWVQGIRRGREERARRLKSLLGPLDHPGANEPVPPPAEGPISVDEDPVEGHREPPS